ncbi:MAG: HEPN domain-containing protein [Alphaproteobacteria bacterium]|nr:HEPN domain-containing protein [Alphaproteobacteria bacterium]
MKPVVNSYLTLASEDIALARKIIDAFPRHAAYAIQQAAEKLIKAVLSAEDIPVPAQHHLGALAQLLPPDHPWRADFAALDVLSGFATTIRYPLPGGRLPRNPDRSDLMDHMKTVASLANEVRDWCEEKG